MSAVLHFLIFLALGLFLRITPRGAPVPPTRDGGIVLVHDVKGKTEYFDQQDARAASAGSPADSRNDQQATLPAREASLNLAAGLPSLPSTDGSLAGLGTGIEDVTGFTQGTGQRPNVKGEVSTSVFGVSGTGSKFIYLFDRSGSMEGYQGRPLDAAKRELIKSLNSLSSVQQFQIVFYNERSHVFNPYFPEKPRLLFGDEATLRQARRFAEGVVADGGTRHMQALRLALGMTPDVVFFLTDAEQPQLSHSELAEIRRMNRGEAVINTIEFGSGLSQGGTNFLVRLANQNRGKHVYVDVTRLQGRRSRSRGGEQP